MLSIEELLEMVGECDDTFTKNKLLDQLFWACLARGLASGTATWGRLFADIRGWSKSGGDNADDGETRISDEEAAILIHAVMGESE